jgi:hypothetical protein
VNRKAIMLKFLTTMILALIIFVPACMFVSRIFTLSDQAKTSFSDFTDEVIDFAQKEDDSDSTVLIMDVGSSIIFFKNEERELVSSKRDDVEHEDGATIKKQNRNFLSYPKQCSSVPCSCLCRAFDEDQKEIIKTFDETNGYSSIKITEYDIQCRSLSCQALHSDIKINSFSHYRSEKDPRRSVINLNKEDGVVSLSVQ